MQYKIPVQIENEDVIVLGLSLRQLTIMMVGGGLTYGIFRSLEGSLSPVFALVIASPFAIIGILVALVRVSEMTFLPFFLNFLRLELNSRERLWSQGTDSYSEMDVGYVQTQQNTQKKTVQKAPKLNTTDIREKMKKL